MSRIEQDAATQVWAATGPELAAAGGRHCVDCAVDESAAKDGGEAARLWALSAQLTGLDLFAGRTPHAGWGCRV